MATEAKGERGKVQRANAGEGRQTLIRTSFDTSDDLTSLKHARKAAAIFQQRVE